MRPSLNADSNPASKPVVVEHYVWRWKDPAASTTVGARAQFSTHSDLSVNTKMTSPPYLNSIDFGILNRFTERGRLTERTILNGFLAWNFITSVISLL
jgi:hypothetical protein